MLYDPHAVASGPLSPADAVRAKRFAPVIRFSANEPFLPSHMGVSILSAARQSPSCTHQVTFEPGVARVIEYALWWDWDIGHLYDLEHVWIKLGADDQILAVEASAHGAFAVMSGPDGALPLELGRVTLYAEPGKHAFHARPDTILARRQELGWACAELAGQGDILVNDMFAHLFAFTPAQHRAVRRHLELQAFTPAFSFTRPVDTAEIEIVSWPELHAHIARRVPELVAAVVARQPLLKAVLIDSGDTLVDEGSEVFDAEGYVTAAELIPGALDMIEALAEQGYRLILVADGRLRSFETVLGGHGIRAHLHAEIISEVLGSQKPAPEMFEAALGAAGLDAGDTPLTVMIGNHLERDIAGANALGITSIWQSWSHRRARLAATAAEVPHYIARTPGEVPALLAHIERELGRKAEARLVGSALAATAPTR